MISSILAMVHSKGAYSAGAFEVTFRLDQSALEAIPSDLRPSLKIERDNSSEAASLSNAAPTGRGNPLFFRVFGLLGILVIFREILEMVRQAYYGGVIIDIRQSPPLITNSKSIPANMIFVIDKDGTITQYKSEEFNESILSGIFGKLSKK